MVGVLSWKSDRYLWRFMVIITEIYKLFAFTRRRRTSSYLHKAYWLRDAPTGLTISAHTLFVLISEQRRTSAPYNITD